MFEFLLTVQSWVNVCNVMSLMNIYSIYSSVPFIEGSDVRSERLIETPLKYTNSSLYFHFSSLKVVKIILFHADSHY